ncbi:MAG: TolB family protein, partial [Acidimicrobiales bacterium]
TGRGAPHGRPSPVVDGAAWSGHGRLAFVSAGQLYILNGAGRLRTVAGPRSVSDPAWSADGLWVAFRRTRGQPYPGKPGQLWVARANGSDAHRISGPGLGVGEFAWSPDAKDNIAFAATPNTTTGSGPAGSRLSLATPTSTRITRLANPTTLATFTFAWAPAGNALALSNTIPSDGPAGAAGTIEVVPIDGGAPTTVLRSAGNTVVVASWWPDGQGLLYWADPGGSASIAADGLPLESLDLASGQSRTLADTLVHRHWLAWSPGGATVALVAGGNRSLWDSGKHLELCAIPAGTCNSVPQPAERVSLDPAWTSSGGLVFTRAPGTAANTFGPPPGIPSIPGQAPYAPGATAAWDAAQHLWSAGPTGAGAQQLAAAGAGAHTPTATSRGLIYVKDGSLWLLGAAGASTVEIARPLGGGVAVQPSYYGYVGWSHDYSWHQ